MTLSQEERYKEKKLLEDIREYVLQEQKTMTAKENGNIPNKIVHLVKRKFRLYKTFEKRTHALFHFEETKKYLTKKHRLENQSITMDMIDHESCHSLKKGTKPYIESKIRIKNFNQEKSKQKTKRRNTN